MDSLAFTQQTNIPVVIGNPRETVDFSSSDAHMLGSIATDILSSELDLVFRDDNDDDDDSDDIVLGNLRNVRRRLMVDGDIFLPFSDYNHDAVDVSSPSETAHSDDGRVRNDEDIPFPSPSSPSESIVASVSQSSDLEGAVSSFPTYGNGGANTVIVQMSGTVPGSQHILPENFSSTDLPSSGCLSATKDYQPPVSRGIIRRPLSTMSSFLVVGPGDISEGAGAGAAEDPITDLLWRHPQKRKKWLKKRWVRVNEIVRGR